MALNDVMTVTNTCSFWDLDLRRRLTNYEIKEMEDLTIILDGLRVSQEEDVMI